VNINCIVALEQDLQTLQQEGGLDAIVCDLCNGLSQVV